MEEIKFQLLIEISDKVETKILPYDEVDYNKRVILLKELDYYDFIIQEILQGGNEKIVLPSSEYYESLANVIFQDDLSKDDLSKDDIKKKVFKVEMNTSWDEDVKKKALYDLIDQIDPTAKYSILDKNILIPTFYEFRIKVEFKISFLSDTVNIGMDFIKEDENVDQSIFDGEKNTVKMLSDSIIEEYRYKFKSLSAVYPKFIDKTKIISTFIESQWSYDQIKLEIDEYLSNCYLSHQSYAYEDVEYREELKKSGYKLEWNKDNNLEKVKTTKLDDVDYFSLTEDEKNELFDLMSEDSEEVKDKLYYEGGDPLPDEAFEDWVEPKLRDGKEGQNPIDNVVKKLYNQFKSKS